eukprot:CAMPEP_0201893842 /NCGR_PEP_ID=MMETSP0902-20130614/39515_1 /ASSEMBLY_ACC=CAM_ASM_000551 /TAXON_ID=420261 /ORGANISM="Thalassiosira antarctica, Strain CCMP982" /LENGTH=184 /DNA_ID=CAMNT_0048425745 /DNA_START=87 /DNA_END=638 /DNA_ORIENTATION=-
MNNLTLFKRLRHIFGEIHYDNEMKDVRPGYHRRISYRDKGWVSYDFLAHSSETDESIISKYLSKLTFQELNSTDENGISILHLAVQYNRGGQTGGQPSDEYTLGKSTTNNIVKWLLDNPSFCQEGAKGTWENDKYNESPNGTALHFAFCAQIPMKLVFCSENHGGRFGQSFVSSQALDSMLDHE